jgi:hypothetical protein
VGAEAAACFVIGMWRPPLCRALVRLWRATNAAAVYRDAAAAPFLGDGGGLRNAPWRRTARLIELIVLGRARHHSSHSTRDTNMINNTRLRKIAWALAPIWASRFEAWQQRRARARRDYERRLEQLANPEAYRPVEPREPRDIESIWRRVNSHRRTGWQAFADELRREHQNYWRNNTPGTDWRDALRTHRGGTSARANFVRTIR